MLYARYRHTKNPHLLTKKTFTNLAAPYYESELIHTVWHFYCYPIILPEHSHIVLKYQNLPLPPPPSPGVHSLNPISPATGSFLYGPNSPTPPEYPPASMNKHSDHLAASYVQRSPSIRRSNRHSLAPSDLPEYRSTYSSDSHIPVPITNKPTRRDNQYPRYQPPFTSRSGPPSPHAQLAALSIPPLRNESRLPYAYLPSAPNSLNHSSSGSNRSSNRSSHERYMDSASLSGYSGYSGLSSSSPSTPTSNGTWQPPAPPPSPNFFFPGSRSVARPRVTSKITISQLKKRRSKSRLRAARSQTSLISPISPSVDHTAFETSPVSPVVQTPIQSSHPDIRSDESAFVHSDDYKRKVPPSVPKAPPENFVFPTARSRAQPKISSKPRSSKSSSYPSKSKDDNSGRSRIIGALFKKKNKGKTPNITPISNRYTKLSDPVVSPVEHPTHPGKRISEESSQESTVHQERTRKLKSRTRSYPLDPYDSVLLDKLSRLVLFNFFTFDIHA